MEIKEAIGYLQAVADNAHGTPKYQRALEMAIRGLEEREALKARLDDVYQALHRCNEENQRLKKELVDERDRFDKASDYAVERDKLIESLRELNAVLRLQLNEAHEDHDRDVAELEAELEQLARVTAMLRKSNAVLTEKMMAGALDLNGGDDEN